MLRIITVIILFVIPPVLLVAGSNVDSTFNLVFPDSSINSKTNRMLLSETARLSSMNPQLALNLLNKVLTFYTVKDSDSLLPSVNNHIGNVYRKSGLINKALTNYLTASDGFLKFKQLIPAGWNYNDIGGLYFQVGLFGEAKEYFYKGLQNFKDFADSAGGEINEYDKRAIFDGYAVSYSNIGLCERELLNYDSAKEYFFKALLYREEEKYGIGKVYTLNYIARLFTMQQKYDSSAYYYDMILNIINETDTNKLDQYNKMQLRDVFISYAKFLYLIGDPNYKKQLDEVVQYFKVNQLHYNLAMLQMDFSGTYFANRDYAKAIAILNQAKVIVEQSNYFIEFANIYDKLSEVYELTGNNELSRKYRTMYSKYQDSINHNHIKMSLINVTNDYRVGKEIADLEEIAMKSEIKAVKYEKQKRINTILIIASVVSAILIVVILYYQRKATRANHLLAQSNESLQNLNNQLVESENKLKELNATKDKFFSIIAHDLRSPSSSLQSSLNYLYTNQNEFDKEELAEFLQALKGASDRLLKLLDDLLTWSLTQLGKVETNLKTQSLTKVSDEVIEIYRPMASSKGVSLVNSVPDTLIISADENALRTILRNLISNAIKYTNEGGRVEVGGIEESGYTVVYVKDEGVGMPQDKLPKLFSISNNESTPGTNDEKGTGLGLVIVSELIANHNGKIDVKSEPGRGTTFFISFPVLAESKES